MEKRIETERLVLRPWCAGDAGALYELARDPEVGTPAGWPPHESVEQSRQIIETVFNTPYVYAVVLKETGEPVGCCGLVAPTPEHSATVAADDAEIGYWLGRAFWGRGLMPEAVTAVAPQARAEGRRRLWIAFYDGNDRSRRVAEKCGFRYHHTETHGGVTEHFHVSE